MREPCEAPVWSPGVGSTCRRWPGRPGTATARPCAHDTESVRKVWKKMVLLTSVDRGQVGPTGHPGHRHWFHVDPKYKHGVKARRNG